MIVNHYEGPRFDPKFPAPHSADTLVSMFYSMLRIRRIEEEIERRYKEDQMKSPIHLVIGQEGSCVGACAAMEKSDLLYLGHRTHGGYLAKGGDLKAMMSELYCKANGCAGSRGGSMHLVDHEAGVAGTSAICGGIIPIAAGAALTAKRRGDKRVTVVFFGDGAAEEGVLWETLNFAQLHELPILFFCENNFYSVCTPLAKRQPKASLFEKAKAFGLRSSVVDGVNAVAVYERAKEDIRQCREGRGPAFIESRVYRWRGHGGAGDDSKLGYRDPLEVKEWEKYCPMEILGERLVKAGFLDGNRRKSMEQEIALEVAEAFDHAIRSPLPDPAELSRFVYAAAPAGATSITKVREGR